MMDLKFQEKWTSKLVMYKLGNGAVQNIPADQWFLFEGEDFTKSFYIGVSLNQISSKPENCFTDFESRYNENYNINFWNGTEEHFLTDIRKQYPQETVYACMLHAYDNFSGEGQDNFIFDKSKEGLERKIKHFKKTCRKEVLE